jgi:hypothetical protein
LHYEIEEFIDGKWEKLNPVVGDQDKVNYTDEVDLNDPPKMINLREQGQKNYENMTNEELIKEFWLMLQRRYSVSRIF